MKTFKAMLSVEIFIDADTEKDAFERVLEIRNNVCKVDLVNDCDFLTIEEEDEIDDNAPIDEIEDMPLEEDEETE